MKGWLAGDLFSSKSIIKTKYWNKDENSILGGNKGKDFSQNKGKKGI
jgi:hypothetical protein